jgi:hypothetical protein
MTRTPYNASERVLRLNSSHLASVVPENGRHRTTSGPALYSALAASDRAASACTWCSGRGITARDGAMGAASARFSSRATPRRGSGGPSCSPSSSPTASWVSSHRQLLNRSMTSTFRTRRSRSPTGSAPPWTAALRIQPGISGWSMTNALRHPAPMCWFTSRAEVRTQHHVCAARRLHQGNAADLAHAGECELDCSTGGSG